MIQSMLKQMVRDKKTMMKALTHWVRVRKQFFEQVNVFPRSAESHNNIAIRKRSSEHIVMFSYCRMSKQRKCSQEISGERQSKRKTHASDWQFCTQLDVQSSRPSAGLKHHLCRQHSIFHHPDCAACCMPPPAGDKGRIEERVCKAY